jgi:hypothetical protein
VGYRSDVMFAFYPAGETETSEIAAWIDKHWPKAWCSIFEYDDHPLVTVKYDDVKWYDDYEYVQSAWAAVREFEEAFNTEEHATHRAHWEMVRIGEDDDDTERGGSMYREYRLGIRREIEIY